MPDSSENNRRDYSKFDDMSTEMLEDMLRADSQLPDGEYSDTDAILYIMEVIAKREKENTTGKSTDVDDAWVSFSKNYLPYIKDDKSLYDYEDLENQTGIKQAFNVKPSQSSRKRRLMRVASIAIAISVLLLAGTVTASALGFDLWSSIAEWTKDTFGFSNATTNTQITQEPSADSQYKSLQDALDNYDVSEKIAPTWFPEGYTLDDINVNETPAKTIIYAKYSNTSSEISINITLLKEPSARTYEKDGDDVIVYSINGIEHYIMSNLDQVNIVWRTENFECSISGTQTLEEAKKMVDSIYERK